MALDLQGYSAPVNQFEGLYRLSDTLGEQQRIKEATQQREQARRASLGGFLTDYLDPKNFMTGTGFDKSYISERVDEIMQKGVQHANMQGADTNTLLGLISGDVNKLLGEVNNIKAVKENVESSLKLIPENSGYNKNALREHALSSAFLGDDGQLVDITKVNANVPWVAEAAKRRPLDVTSSSVFTDAVNKFGISSGTKEVKRQNSKGGLERRLSSVKSKSIFEYDEDAQKWVPKYALATDAGKPIMGKFDDGKGGTVEAQMRVVPEEYYNQMISSSPALADRIRGEVEMYAKAHGIENINPTQEKYIGRLMLYENLKGLATGDIDDIQQTKENPAPKTTNNISIGGNNSGVEYNNQYKVIKDYVTSTQKGGVGASFTGLPLDAQNTIMSLINTGKGEADKRKEGDIYLREENGTIHVMDAHKRPPQGQKIPSDAYLGQLPEGAINVKATTGAKGKVAAQNAAGTTTVPTKPKTNVDADAARAAGENNGVSQKTLKSGTIVYKNGKAVKLTREVSLDEVTKAGFSTTK